MDRAVDRTRCKQRERLAGIDAVSNSAHSHRTIRRVMINEASSGHHTHAMHIRLILPALCLLALSACDDPSDFSDRELEQLEADDEVDSLNSNLIDELSAMPDNDDQNIEPDPEQPQVGDIVLSENIPDRSVYLMNLGELPLKGLLLRVGDLDMSELDTPAFIEWRAGKCSEYIAEHPEILDPSVVICEYTFNV